MSPLLLKLQLTRIFASLSNVFSNLSYFYNLKASINKASYEKTEGGGGVIINIKVTSLMSF